MDRDDKLKAAKEKLKDFQNKKRQDEISKFPPSFVSLTTSEPTSSITSYFTSITEDPFANIEQTSNSESLSELSNQISELYTESSQLVAEESINIKQNSEASEILGSKEKKLEEIINEQNQRLIYLESFSHCQSKTIFDLQEEIESLSTTQQNEEPFLSLQESFKTLQNEYNCLFKEKCELEKSHFSTKVLLEAKENEISKLTLIIDENNKRNEYEKEKKIQNIEYEEEIKKLTNELQTSQESYVNTMTEYSEINSKLTSKMKENKELNKEREELKRQIELLELNNLQLKNVKGQELDDHDHDDEKKNLRENLNDYKSLNEQQSQKILELSNYISEAHGEKESIISQYSNYSKTLIAQIEGLSSSLSEKVKENKERELREKELLVENNVLQSQMERVLADKGSHESFSSKSQNNSNLDYNSLLEKYKGLEIKFNIQSQLSRELESEDSLLRNKLSEMETELEMLKSSLELTTVNESLIEDNESDKVAASRAMKQNIELKEQYEEMSSALIVLTNSKVELMDELDNLKRRYAKENESHSNEIITLKQENQDLKNRISTIETKEREEKKKKRDQGIRNNPTFESASPTYTGNDDDVINIVKIDGYDDENSRLGEFERISKANIIKSRHSPIDSSSSSSSKESYESSSTDSFVHISSPQSDSEIQFLHSETATLKLEDKFKWSMEKISQLSQDKEYLKDLVSHLEEETETIGEYIVLYQFHRNEFRKAMLEKDNQLRTLSLEYEELRHKFEEFQRLIKSIFIEPEKQSSLNQTNNNKNKNPNNSFTPSMTPLTMEAKEQLKTLMSQMGSHQNISEKFHPWFWESKAGKLMTV